MILDCIFYGKKMGIKETNTAEGISFWLQHEENFSPKLFEQIFLSFFTVNYLFLENYKISQLQA